MKRKSWLSIVLMTVLLCAWAIGGLAQEGVLTLPENLKEIEDEAFYGDTSLGEVVLPEGIEKIGSRAFAGSTVSVINLPASITSIADDAFDGCGAMEVSAQEGSYAYDWAVEKGHSILKPATPASSFAYSIANEEVTITAFVGDETEVMIPRSIEGYPVTSIGDSAFKDRSDLTSVSIPDGVTSIGVSAFRNCSSMTSIMIPNGVTSIGYNAFYGCRSLTSIELPDSVTSIGDWAFSYCSGLTSIELPDGVTSIGECAFYECSGLTSINIPDGVTSIGEWAFSGCISLTSIELPEGVTSIGEGAFYGCRSLTSIELPDSITSIGGGAFYECSSLTSVELPDGVTSIAYFAFYGCNSVTSIELPDSVTSIDEFAFGYCSSLTNINIPDGVTSIGSDAFYGCSSLTSIELPDSITSIGGFYECSSLTSVELPDGVTSIGAYTFYGCSSLTSIELPDSVTSIDEFAFGYCSSLTNINIPDGVTSIGSDAFYGCSSLTSIELPDSITSIGSGAFYECSSLTSINIPDGVTSIGAYTFYGCSSLTSINIPDSVTNIDNSAFKYCRSLTSIELPNSVTSIGWDAFIGCSSLTSIELPDSVTNIDHGAFEYCSSLTSIELPDSVTSIGYSAFYECSGLTSIELPDGVASIGESAFRYCRNLMSISIPESVTSIGNYAFDSCDNLTIYGVSGSYAETYATENSIPFIEGEMPKVFPTLADFTLNATPLEITVPMGTELVFGGTISAGSAQLVDVQASVFLASDHEQGAVYEREEDINADTYDLSRLSPMTVGAEYNGFAMTAGNSYDVMLYVTDGNGRGFESDPYIRVHVVEAGEITWYAEVADEAGNALSSVTLPHTGEYAGRICVRTNNGNMTAWVDEGFPFDFALESVEPQDDGAYVFTYALSAPLILFDEVRTDTVLFCLRDENSTAITDTPLAQLTITQEGNPTPPEIFSITDREGNDLTTTPLKLDYTGACATDVIVHGNYAAITAWFNTVTTIDFGAPVETVLEDGTIQLVFSDVRAGENVTASDIARTCVFYAYTTDASNPDKSKPLGEIQVVQEENPYLAIVKSITLKNSASEDFNASNQLIVENGHHEGYNLIVEINEDYQNDVFPNGEVVWYIYSDDPNTVFAYSKDDGQYYIKAEKAGTASIYISHQYVDNKEFHTLECVHYVCDVQVNLSNLDKGLTAQTSLLNPYLAKVSMTYAALAYGDLGADGNPINENGADAVNRAMKENGFEVLKVSGYDKPTNERYVAYSIARKSIIMDEQEKIVYAVIIRGTSDGIEWLYNFDVGSGTTHLDFNACAGQIKAAVQDIMKEKGDESANIWITGHSRGAAVGNLLAKRCLEDANFEQVFAYTYATPAVSTSCDDTLPIYNFVDKADLIPMLPMKEWGYGRHGCTIYFGSADVVMNTIPSELVLAMDGEQKNLIDLYYDIEDEVRTYLIDKSGMDGLKALITVLAKSNRPYLATAFAVALTKMDDIVAHHEQSNYIQAVDNIQSIL